MKYKMTILSATVVLALVCVTGCFSQKSTSSATKPAGASAHPTYSAWTSTRTVDIQDPGYGMKAYTLAVPTGWKYAGMILRPGGCHPPSVPASGLSYTEQSPDGLTAFAQLPGVSWSWTSNGSNAMGAKCPSNININTAAGLLLNIAVPNLHPNAISVTVVPLPQPMQDSIKAQNQKLQSMATSFGRQFADAARVDVQYELNGVVEDESLITVIDCTDSSFPAMPGGFGRPQTPGYTRRFCGSRGTLVTRAPKGHLDEALKARIFPQINAEWDNRVIHDMQANFQQFQAASDAQFKANLKYYADQNQQMLNRNKEFQDSMRDSTNRALQNDRNRQAAMSDSAHQTALYSLDRQNFVNPSTGQRIEASSQFNHQWMSSDGSTVIQTQDHSYDPNGAVYPVSQSWTELVPTN